MELDYNNIARLFRLLRHHFKKNWRIITAKTIAYIYCFGIFCLMALYYSYTIRIAVKPLSYFIIILITLFAYLLYVTINHLIVRAVVSHRTLLIFDSLLFATLLCITVSDTWAENYYSAQASSHNRSEAHTHRVHIRLSNDTTDYVEPMVFRAVEQETHYYPFGMPFGESTATALRAVNGSALQPRRYGGKESVSLGEFTFLDFPARPYDAATARFLTPDPLQEDYTPFSPYLYCMANPMNYTDPTGLFVEYEGSEEEIEQLKEIIAGERQDKLFDRIFQALDDSNVKFTLKFGEIKCKGFNMGVFNKKYKTITLSPLLNERKGGQLHSTVAEEAYHAYQSITPEINNVNIEYEAQTFAYIHTINLNCEYLTHRLVELNANIENYITSTPTNINGNLVDKTCFNYRPSFPTCYKAGFNYFLDSVKNINSSHYTNPSDAVPYRLLNILMTVTWLP